jgi:hypothetical protein
MPPDVTLGFMRDKLQQQPSVSLRAAATVAKTFIHAAQLHGGLKPDPF